MEKELDFKEIKLGMKVIDSDCHIGFIKQIDDIHNVDIEYDSGGMGIY